MARRPSPARIKRHHVYTVPEAAEALGRDPRTVYRWIDVEGLPAITDARPALIRGEVLKDWLARRTQARRSRMANAEVWCLPCRRAVRPAGDMVEYRARNAAGGLVVGICPHCDRLVHRAVGVEDLAAFSRRLEVTLA